MNVNLTPQLEELVRSKVASGMYTSASEVVREALRLMDEQDRLRAAKLEELRDDIRQGMDSGASQTWSAEAAKCEGRARRARKTT
jgi:antitoxin ParD1/3/4